MATDHHYRHRLRIRRRRPTCCILSLLLLCCITLFIFIYRRSAGRSISALFPEAEDKRPVRRFAIELHPKDHTQRLPTSLTHHWNITKGIRAPDGVEKIVYLINGEQCLLTPRGLADSHSQATFLDPRLKRGRETSSLLLSQTSWMVKKALQFIGMVYTCKVSLPYRSLQPVADSDFC